MAQNGGGPLAFVPSLGRYLHNTPLILTGERSYRFLELYVLHPHSGIMISEKMEHLLEFAIFLGLKQERKDGYIIFNIIYPSFL